MISMRSRNGAGIGPSWFGRSYEKDLRQIKRQIEIVIAERVVLLGIENLEQRRSRIATIVVTELVDLVQHQHRVIHPGAPDRLNDPAGHRADVRAAVAA
jgi:hypothetical protein